MTPEIEAAAKAVKRAQKAAKRATNKAAKALGALKEICDHSELEECKSYDPGGYLDCASTSYWNKCMTCGACSEVTTKMHGHYN